MAVYEYRATDRNKEGHEEVGRIVARDKNEVREKLQKYGLRLVGLKRMQGLSALMGRITADIR